MPSILLTLKQLYRKKQLLDQIKHLNSIALIGHDFCADNSSQIYNESLDKSRVVIGHNCHHYGALFCNSNGRVEIGDYTTIRPGVLLRCANLIKVGSFCGIAESTMITDNNTHSTDIEDWVAHRILTSPTGAGYPGYGFGWEHSESAPVIIGDGVWIGGNCTILKGVTIGDGAIVARAAVVTKDVEPFTIVAGNPAKLVKRLRIPDVSVMEIAARLLGKEN